MFGGAYRMPSIDLLDPMLFGNDAAENEDEESLHYFFVNQDIFETFEDEGRPFSICRARKGMGKSALIVHTATKKEQDTDNTVVRMTGSELLFGDLDSKVPSLFLERWDAVLNAIIQEHFDEQSDSRKSELSALSDLIASNSQIVASVTTQRLWIFIDDIDATFKNTQFERLYLSNFFTACRLLTAKYKFVRIRLSVRQDVWTTIRPTDEALDKCEQYMFDIRWSRNQTRQILAKRIRRYLGFQEYFGKYARRPDSIVEYVNEIREFEIVHDTKILENIFVSPFPWGNGVSEPHHVIHVFSGGRPRWALQICKEAAHVAVSTHHNQIKFSNINSILPKYGQFRIADLIREHSHQCTNLDEIITSFFRARPRYTTIQLVEYLQKRVCKYYSIVIDDNKDSASALEICHFI
jgi:hypothetical protein